MTNRQKKLASNLLFGLGLPFAIIAFIFTMFASSMLGDGALLFGFTLFALGLIAALAGIVVGFIPASRN